MPVRKAIHEFKRLSLQAFSNQDSKGPSLFRHSAQFLFSHRYKGEGLNSALQAAFGRQPLLFGPNEYSTSEKVKVGVLAAVPGGRRPYLFTNYSRNPTSPDNDYLVREDDLADEMRCWEAARSTAAAPTYFPPYYHEAKRQPYIDGAVHRNNPIQILEEERRAIWKDKAPPDILLSIGTGIQIGADGTPKDVARAQKTAMRLRWKGLRGRLAVGLDVIQSTLDCNRQWDEFVSAVEWDRHTHRVCHRLNIGLKERPPKLDDVDAIDDLRDKARRYMRPDHASYLNDRYPSAHKHIVAVAQRLVAALFYFEAIHINEDERCIGFLHCRLSRSMRSNFRHLLSEGPTFRVCHKIRGGNWCSSIFRPNFDDRTFSGRIIFQIRSKHRVIEMTLPRWGGSWERISGFSGPQS
ncbi:MAG: hypothetical protein HETSPECPRED_004827 [Heterodermia speciosa]|uniref:PNPLA domain-containing protein n=1 Tax=Heterodermia speciosa TaxID=116794 RepID=A0A8H3ED61_9LECA|nr:MAG: hypothetical protein HETSPECPRED_004827 [Heterodermia speciosa]